MLGGLWWGAKCLSECISFLSLFQTPPPGGAGYGMANMCMDRYDVAILYLEQANYDLEMAMDVYKDDERWEEEHPISGNKKGEGKTRLDVGRRRFTGQRS